MSLMKKVVVVSSLCLLPVSMGFAYDQKAIYEKPDGTNIGAGVTFSYKDDSMFHVNTKPGFVTDIQLRKGEELTYVAGGDTKSFLIDKAMVGDVQHVYIKPLFPDKHTNIIMNTDSHTYRLDVSSSMDNYDPLIRFFFREDSGRNKNQVKSYSSNSLYGNLSSMNRDYEIKAKKMERFGELVPKEIMDDGQRTYIRIPDTNKYDMPVLYMINPWDKKRTLINYRVLNGYFVADIVMERGVLMFHQKYSIEFRNLAKDKMKPGTMRYRLASLRKDDGFVGSRPALEENDVKSWNPVEEKVYTVPEEAIEVKPASVKREAPPRRQEMQREYRQPVEQQVEQPRPRPRPVRQQVQQAPAPCPVQQVQPVQQVRQVQRAPQPRQEVQLVRPEMVQRPVNRNYPGAGYIAEYVAGMAGLK